jgi:hypothetical protein
MKPTALVIYQKRIFILKEIGRPPPPPPPPQKKILKTQQKLFGAECCPYISKNFSIYNGTVPLRSPNRVQVLYLHQFFKCLPLLLTFWNFLKIFLNSTL